MKIMFEDSEYSKMRNDPGNYKWGIFYFNSQDSRFVVPKRNPWMGWTFNFAHPGSYLILGGIFLFAYLMNQYYN